MNPLFVSLPGYSGNPPVQLKKETISVLDIPNIDQFIDATTTDSQIRFLYKLTENYQRSKSVLPVSTIKFVIYAFLESPMKHPLKKASSKLLLALNKSHENEIEELTYIQLVNFFKSVQFEDAKSVNNVYDAFRSCIDIFPQYTNEIYTTSILNFLKSVLELNVNTLKKELSPTKKSDIHSYIHNTFRLQMSILKQYDSKLDFIKSDYWDSLKSLCLLLLRYEDLPMDTKINCCTIFVYILIETQGRNSWVLLLKNIFCVDSHDEGFLIEGDDLILFRTVYIQLGICNAIINVIEPSLQYDYTIGSMCALQFITNNLVHISESLSVNTEIVLGVSRAVLVISKLPLLQINWDVENTDVRESIKIADIILTFLWSFLNHYNDTVRHLCIQILNNVVKLANILNKRGLCHLLSHKITMTTFATVKNDQYKYYVLLRALGLEFNYSYLLNQNPRLIEDMLSDINTSSDMSIVSSTYEVLMTKHLKEDSCEVVFDAWVIPILNKIISYESMTENEQSPVVTMMREILHNAVKIEPSIAKLMTSTLLKPKEGKILSDGQFKCMLICLNVAKKSGYFDKHKDSFDGPLELWKGVLSYDLLNDGITHQNTEICMLASNLIIDSHKTTEPFNYKDFDLATNFFKYNISINIASIKQEILRVTKKLFDRWEMSYQKLNKNPTDLQNMFNRKLNKDEMWSVHKKIMTSYETFMDNVYVICFDNIFPNANFCRRNVSMQVLQSCLDLSSKFSMNFEILEKSRHIKQLYNYLDDSYECNKLLAMKILSHPSIYANLYPDDIKWTSDYEEAILKASSIKPTDCISSAYKLELLTIKPSEIPYQSHYNMMSKLLEKLRVELCIASNNILEASANGPMYGLIFCITHIYNLINLSQIPEDQNLKWINLIQDVIKICFSINTVVLPIVNNSSPEGHLPMDFSSDTIQVHGNNLELENGMIVSAQMVLLCGWRSVKEVSLLLGDIVSKSKIIDDVKIADDTSKLGMITKQQMLDIGDHFMTLLSETKHRGAFEKAYVGFTKLCSRLWKCQSNELHSLPKIWLKDLMTVISSNSTATSKLCSTRRSAGVPYIVQALVITELQVNNNIQNFEDCMLSLLDMARNQDYTVVTRTHSLNILRALYRHTALGEHVNPYVSEGLVISIKGFEGTTWAERNSSTLLFSSLMTRIFGVTRTKDTEQLSMKNKMTGKNFFLQYPKLYDFLLTYLDEVVGQSEVKRNKNYLCPSLYPILLLLSRLYPSPLDGTDSNLQLEAFVPYLIMCSGNSVLKIRQLAAKAVLQIVNSESYGVYLLNNIQLLCYGNNKNTNFMHGIFLQIIKLLPNLSKRTMEDTHFIANISPFLKHCVHFLNRIFVDSAPCFINAEAYLHTLLLFAIKFPESLHIDKEFYLCIRNKLHDSIPIHNNSILYGLNQYYATSLHLNFQLTSILSKNSLISLIQFYLEHPSHEVISLMLNYLICFYNQTNSEDVSKSFDIGQFEMTFVERLEIKDVIELLDRLNETEWYIERILTLSKQCNDYEYKDKAQRLLFFINPNAAYDYVGVSKSMNGDEFFDALEKYDYNGQYECYLLLRCIDGYLEEKHDLSITSDRKLSEILMQNCMIDTDESNRLVVAQIFTKHWKSLGWRSECINDEKFSVNVMQWSIVFKLLIDESKAVSYEMSKLSYLIMHDYQSSMSKFQQNENKSKAIILKTLTDWLSEKSFKHALVMLMMLAMGDNSNNTKEEIQVFEKEDTFDIEEECALTNLCVKQLETILTKDNVSNLMGDGSTIKSKIGATIVSICKFKDNWNVDHLLKSLLKTNNLEQFDQITQYKMELIIELIDKLNKNTYMI